MEETLRGVGRARARGAGNRGADRGAIRRGRRSLRKRGKC